MFNDKRSKKIILVAHCLLNQNSISDNTADFPSQFEEAVTLLMSYQVGIIQLPCPELACLGLDRKDKAGGKREILKENSRIRNLMQKEENITILKSMAREQVKQIEDYKKHAFGVVGLIGMNRSPSCGIDTTSKDGKEMKGKGIFMEILENEFKRKNIEIKMIGVETSSIEDSLERVSGIIGKERGK